MNRIIACMIALALSTAPLSAQDIPLSKILVEKEGWREVAKDLSGITFLEAEPAGSIAIFQANTVARLHPQGKIEKRKSSADKDERRDQRIVWTTTGKMLFSIDWGSISVAHRSGKLQLPGARMSCLTLWPDDGQLVIGKEEGAYLWAYRIEKDGSLGPGDRYYSLRTKPNEKMHVTAMTMDAGYLLYACTPLGIQVFDPTGRLSGVIAAPAKEPMTAITIGGEKADTLFVASGERIYARKIQGKAIYTLKKDK